VSGGRVAYSIRQHTSAYVSIRQHTSAYLRRCRGDASLTAYVSIRQHTSAYVSISQHTCAGVGGTRRLQRLCHHPKRDEERGETTGSAAAALQCMQTQTRHADAGQWRQVCRRQVCRRQVCRRRPLRRGVGEGCGRGRRMRVLGSLLLRCCSSVECFRSHSSSAVVM
jgi:hypothetical protein